MNEPEISDFPPGERFDIELEDGPLGLVVQQALELPGAMRKGGGFRIEFLGPQQPVLPQSIYPLRRGNQQFDIFIVPVGQSPDGTRYDAIFY